MTAVDTITVVAVGIERYPAEPGWTESGPARDARRFASLAQTKGVPRENILVLVSPNASGPDAIKANLANLLTEELVHRKGDQLIVFWSGHGYQDQLGARLLLPDGSDDISSVGVDQLRGWLATEKIRFAEQAFFVDACRQHENPRRYLTPPLEFPVARRAYERSQFSLHAVAIGEESALVAAENSSVFCMALFPELAKLEINEWPAAIPSLAERLPAHDPRLAPVTVTHTDPRGNAGQVHLGGPRAETETPVARVIRALLRVPPMRNRRDRQRLLDAISTKFDGLIFKTEPEVSTIVINVAQMDGGWKALRDVCHEHPTLFPPQSNAVIALEKVLHDLIEPTGSTRA